MIPFARELSMAASRTVSVALETNGKGFHGFIVELPGAFVRGVRAEEALSKAHREVRSYLAWLGEELKNPPEAQVVQTHQCNLPVEDADCEILLDADQTAMNDREFRQLVELVKHSGLSFEKLYDSAHLKDWIDKARIRKTFYGENKKTIREIFDHVKRTQYYYLSRMGIRFGEDEGLPFMEIRESSLDNLMDLFGEEGNSVVHSIQNEAWTLKKVLRRFVWHDRIHGKAITRILEKQLGLGLVDGYEDPFQFKTHSSAQLNDFL